MSIGNVLCRASVGIAAPLVRVEVFLSGGLPTFSVSGMAETAVRESKDRVRSAIINAGFRFPQERITVSLAPADMPKSGSRFDLAIALGILVAAKALPQCVLEHTECYGELALSGEVKPVPGLLADAIKAREAGHTMLVPLANGGDAAFAHADVIGVSSLLEATAHLTGETLLMPVRPPPAAPATRTADDLAAVRGQARAKRALEIAAAGGHNLLFSGPPGTGKSLLARCLPGLLPDLECDDALETLAVESLLGLSREHWAWRKRPFRAPHHTASAPALVGGGPGPKPGEVSRAHNGVLFLDELPEFSRHVLEVLREPLETGMITIARVNAQVDFPARFMLIAAMNPCPCGYLGEEGCRCSSERVTRYRAKISGPLLDRIDLKVDVARPPAAAFRGPAEGESTRRVRQRVIEARRIATDRQGVANAELKVKAMERLCSLDDESWRLLETAVDSLGISARGLHRTTRVARTIADLAGDQTIKPPHVAEALTFRNEQ